jgi:hypothetical protein
VADHQDCVACGGTLARWSDHKLRAFRLVIAAERKYASMPVPPSPVLTLA